MRSSYIRAGADLALAIRADARAARVARDTEAARRAARREAGEALPPKLDVTDATPRQRTAMCAAADELATRERATPAAALRGWKRLHYAGPVPPGCRALCMLMPTRTEGRMVRLVVDQIGRLHMAEGAAAGAVTSVAEAVRLARG